MDGTNPQQTQQNRDLSRREVLQGAAVAAAALVAQACAQPTPQAAPLGHTAYSQAVGATMAVEIAGQEAGRLKLIEVTPRRTLVAPGVGTFDSYSLLFAGAPLAQAPQAPVVVSGGGLKPHAINLFPVDRPAADGTVLYQAVFNVPAGS